MISFPDLLAAGALSGRSALPQRSIEWSVRTPGAALELDSIDLLAYT
jgi:hypothetical protein